MSPARSTSISASRVLMPRSSSTKSVAVAICVQSSEKNTGLSRQSKQQKSATGSQLARKGAARARHRGALGQRHCPSLPESCQCPLIQTDEGARHP
jgi:hypothetical protein